MRKFLILLALGVGMMSFPGGYGLASGEEPMPGQAKKLRIVASILPMYAHVRSITGELADVEQLLGKESGPHEAQLKPSDAKRLAQADLLVLNGAGLESWLADVTEKSGNSALTVVDASAGIELLVNPEVMEMGDGHTHGHAHGHDHGTGDRNPHTWLDPVLAQKQVATILQALRQADPANAEAYARNAQAYTEKLRKLDESFRQRLAASKGAKLVTLHDAFVYLAKRYELDYIGYIEAFPETNPSPRQLASLADRMKSRGVKVVFAEEGYSPRMAETLARETDAKVALLDTLEVGEPAADAYLERMEKNLESLSSIR